MIHFNFSEIHSLLADELVQTINYSNLPTANFVRGFSIDTRTIEQNNLFCALSGTQVDGHDFLMNAYEKGASGALVTQFNPNIPDAFPQWVVHDVPRAMGILARAWRHQFSIPFIGITGSNGKTSVKNMTAEILKGYTQNQHAILYPERTFNNHIGVPLTLAKLNSSHRYAVLELGMNHFHEIEWLSSLINPDIAAITLAGPAHLAGVGGTIQGVAQAKAEIFSGLSSSGIGVLNRDDPFFEFWKNKLDGRSLISFGWHAEADVRCIQLQGNSFIAQFQDHSISIKLPLLGKHQIANALTAIAIAQALKIPLGICKHALENMQPAAGRMTPSPLMNHSLLIDDTYNANPLSLKAALMTMQELSPQFNKTILILGAMRELGEETEKAHAEAGKLAKQMGVTHLLAYAPECQRTVETFGAASQWFENQTQLCEALDPLFGEKTLILVKGSRSTRMENVCHKIIEKYAENATV